MDADRRIVPNPKVVFRPLDEGGVVLEVDTGAYFELNSSGRFLWEALEDRPTFAQLVDIASKHYGLDIAADVDEFVRALDERRLIEPA